MKVIGPRVVVQRIESPALKSSLIEIVEFDPDPSQFGLVLAVGSFTYRDGTRHPIEGVNVGDVVVLKKFSGAPIPIRDKDGGEMEDAFMVMADDVLAVVEL